MGEWLKDNPIGSQIINLALCMIIVVGGILFVKIKYFNVAVDTNKRIRNIEYHVVPDSLIYFNNERN